MASGNSLTASGASIVANLRALTGDSGQASKQLKALDPRGALAAKRGRADYKAPSTGSGGISGPLTEILNEDGSSTRVYHDHTTKLYSNDYLLAVEINPLKTLSTHDGDGNLLQINFAKPTIES
jgi:hypothetical protein